MNDILYVKTISELHEILGYESPKHPLITVIDLSKLEFPKELLAKPIVMSFYTVFMKDKCFGKFQYGRSSYDYRDGVLAFMAPEQNFLIEELYSDIKMEGFALFVHPDLFRRTTLANKIHEYTFFSYSSNEALHLSDKEKETIKRIVDEIENELDINMDSFTNELIVSNFDLILNYSKRFYNRQFLTRENLNKDIIETFEDFLYERINGNLKDEGIPTVKECAQKMCYSTNYLSDMLKKETGKNTKEYIYIYLMEKAKNMLLSSDKTVNEIAYDLGFEYPEHFSRMFKKRVGVSPIKFRNELEN